MLLRTRCGSNPLVADFFDFPRSFHFAFLSRSSFAPHQVSWRQHRTVPEKVTFVLTDTNGPAQGFETKYRAAKHIVMMWGAEWAKHVVEEPEYRREKPAKRSRESGEGSGE